MFWYSIRRLNLFVITLLILTFVGYSLVRLDPESYWAAQTFVPGWFDYVTQLSQLDFGVTKSGGSDYSGAVSGSACDTRTLLCRLYYLFIRWYSSWHYRRHETRKMAG